MHEFVCVCGISDMDRGVFFIDSIAFFLIIRRIINAFDAFLSLYLLKICLKMFHSSLNLNQQCMEKKEQKYVRGIHKKLNQIIVRCRLKFGCLM